MSLYDTIDSDLKSALKSKDSIRLSTLRMVRTALKNKEVELRRKLEEPEILRIFAQQAKQHKDSIEQYERGGRHDLADKEKQELAILESYLPSQLGEEELRSVIKAIIAETGASGVKDIGKVMKEAMVRLAGKADGKIVNKIVKDLLSS